MASNFPSSLDSFTNPSSSDALDSVSVPHASQHSDLNDAVEALQAKVGADSSAVTSSHDYLIDKQSVVPYDDASARTTAVPSPVEGQMSYLKDMNSVEVYDGSEWKIIYKPRASFTPTWVNLTVGNAVVQAWYAISGDMMTVELNLEWGSTTSVTTNPTLVLPSGFAPITNGLPCGVVEFRDTGTANYIGAVVAYTSGLQAIPWTVNATYPTKSTFSSTVPFTWAAGDFIRYVATFNWQAV